MLNNTLIHFCWYFSNAHKEGMEKQIGFSDGIEFSFLKKTVIINDEPYLIEKITRCSRREHGNDK